MSATPIRTLIVDDFLPFRQFIFSVFKTRTDLKIICEVSDGIEAVQKAKELQPDLILLDIGLPGMNGLEVVREVRRLSSKSKVIIVSENRSRDVVEKALRTAAGYVIKAHAETELLRAVDAVLAGQRFVSAGLLDHAVASFHAVCHHDMGIYTNERHLLDEVAQFISRTFESGNAAIVIANESHRGRALARLQSHGFQIGLTIEHGRYIGLDVAEALSTIMINGMPDRTRFNQLFGGLIRSAASATKRSHPHIAIYGEYAHLLWSEGNVEAAIELEKLGNELTSSHDVDILCGYSLGDIQSVMDSKVFKRICAEHSAVFFR